MRKPTTSGVPVALLRASHPLFSAAVALGVAVAAAVSGRDLREVAVVFVVVLLGRATAGWLNDVVDRVRDAQAGRTDKPVAQGQVPPGTVTFTMAVVTLLVVPLSVLNGNTAGIAHLLSVAAAWAYNTRIKLTALSWLPWAVSFGLLPAFLSYGGWGGATEGDPPTWAMTALAALLGVLVHVLTSLTDLSADHANGVRSLPVRLGLKLGAQRLLWVTAALLVADAAGLVVAGLTVGLRQ